MAHPMTVREVESAALWDEFVAASPQGTVFSTSAWMRAAAAAHGGEPRMFGVWQQDRLVAGASCVHLAKWPFRKATTPVLTPYGGMIYRPDPGKRRSEAGYFNLTCAELLASSLRKSYNYILLANAPGMDDVRPFTWAGWRATVRYTYLLDIADPDGIWEVMERRVRTVIRNAEETLELGGEVSLDEFGELYRRIYSDRSIAPPVPRMMVTAMTDAVLRAGLGEMRSVRNERGEIVSVMVLVHDDRRVYAWISGSLPGENNSGAFSLLFWDAVKRYSGTRSQLDMVGANIPSIAFFKKGFGGVLTPYYTTEVWSSRAARTALSAYSALRRMAR